MKHDNPQPQNIRKDADVPRTIIHTGPPLTDICNDPDDRRHLVPAEDIHQQIHETTQAERCEREIDLALKLRPYSEHIAAGKSAYGITPEELRADIHTAPEPRRSKEWLRGYNEAVESLNRGPATSEQVKALIGQARADLEPNDFTKGWVHACQWHLDNNVNLATDRYLIIVLHNRYVRYTARDGTGIMAMANTTHEDCIKHILATVPHDDYEIIDDRTPEPLTRWYERPIIGPVSTRDIAEIIGICVMFVAAIIALFFALVISN